MQNVIESRLDQLRQELAENTRLRLGVWLILVLFMLWASLVWSDFNRSLYDNVRKAERDLVSLQEIEPLDVWESRRKALSQMEQGEGQKLFAADSVGLAQARIQSLLDELVVRDAATRIAIKNGTPQPLSINPDLQRMRVRIATSLTSVQLRESLRNIESYPKLLMIDQMDIRKDGLRWNTELTLSTYIQLGAD